MVSGAPPWHALAPDETLARLDTSARGLDAREAEARARRWGRNALPPAKRRSALARFLAQFANLLVQVLLVAGVITFALGHLVDAAVIVGVTLINAVIGFVQEGKAERSLEAVQAMLASKATVLRDGRRKEIPAADLVPGDVVMLSSGDRVPADLRLLRGRNLRADEAALTGESMPVDKAVPEVDESAPLAERASLLFSGTNVTFGQGVGVVVATGARTEIGRIGGLVASVQELSTPLVRKLDQFAWRQTWFILAGSALTFLFGRYVHGFETVEMFLAVVGLAVAAIPEGLPAIVTVTLAIGTQRMARRNAIVRRLPAVEALGAVTVICTDKTGTLTRNEMTAVRVATPAADFDVDGAGYAPEGGFSCDGQPVVAQRVEPLLELARCALLCNEARVWREDGQWKVAGDPTELALFTLALKAGLDPDVEREAHPRIDDLPFESENRFMATLHRARGEGTVVFLKGAPERVLDLCAPDAADRAQRAHWEERVRQMAAAGERVLGLAEADMPAGVDLIRMDELAGRFRLLGLVGIIDPPRPEAATAIERCRAAGIDVKMITGDHVATAAAIGGRLGLDPTEPLSGPEIESSSDETLSRRLASAAVIARASPEHKMRLVASLQGEGQIVAMTGDGVNDAPALKAADIGVAMGRKGTDAAREAADLVLADDNFATIANAVHEGRTIYDNIKKSLLFILPTNGGEACVILIAVFLGMALPVTAVQILWVNMVTTVTLDVALAFEPAERGAMGRPPRPPAEPMITRLLLARVLYVTVLLAGMTFWLFEFELSRGLSLEAARTSAVNMLVIGELVYLFNCRYFTAHAFSWQALVGNRVALLAVFSVAAMQVAFTYAPPLQQLFDTRSLDALSWALVLGLSAGKFVAVELEKTVLRRFGISRL